MVSDSGEIIGKYRKVHPAGVRSLELIYYRGGTRFPVWDVKGFKVGVITCYDWMFPEAARSAAVNGAELLLGPYAAPAKEQWDAMMITRAYENALYAAPCNKVGREGDWVFGGASMVVDPFGKILHRASTEKDEAFLVSLDQQQVIDVRVRCPIFRDRRPEAYAPLVSQDEDARGLIA
jgi:predicted amidohydrolase